MKHLKHDLEKKIFFFYEAFFINGLSKYIMKLRISHIYDNFYAFLCSYLESTGNFVIIWTFSYRSEHYFS